MNPHASIPDSAWAFLNELSKHPLIQSMILFGSRALGDYDDRSDIDVAICGSQINRADWAQIREAAFLSKSLYWISLVHFDANPPKLKERIRNTGVVIYARTQVARQSK